MQLSEYVLPFATYFAEFLGTQGLSFSKSRFFPPFCTLRLQAVNVFGMMIDVTCTDLPETEQECRF